MTNSTHAQRAGELAQSAQNANRSLLARARHLGATVGVALLMSACGGGGGGGGSSAPALNDESQLELYPNACIATMTEDYSIQRLDTDYITFKAGERYLLSEYEDFAGEIRAEVFVLTADGPKKFDIEVDEDGEVPFTSNCELDEGVSHLAVFKETTFYLDEALTQEACTISAGSYAPGGGGFSLSSDIDLTDQTSPATYQISMAALAEQCDGHGSTYIAVEPTEFLGGTTYLVPVQRFVALPEAE